MALRASVLAIAVLAAASIVLLWLKQRRPEQDLRVSFHIPVAAPANPAITYTLHNLGRDAAALRGVGLLAIADNPPIVNDSDNIDLCDKVDPTTLQPPDQLTAPGAELGGSGQKRLEYPPASVTIAGRPWMSGSPLDIAAGQSLSVAATFKVDTQLTKTYSNLVFCPIIWLARADHAGATAVCQGFAMATNNGGVSNTIVARQFRILPASLGASCPIAGR